MSFPLSVICVAGLIVSLLMVSWYVFIHDKDIIEMKKKLGMDNKIRKSYIKEFVFWLLLGFGLFGVIYGVNHLLF